MKKLTAVLLSVLLLASSLPISALTSEASETSETVAADIVKTEPETTDSVSQPIENTTILENPAVDEKPTEATPAKAAEPVGAKQEEQPVGKSSFTYTVTNNQVTITGLSDEYLTDLVIPETIEDLPVTAIKGYAFNGCSQITSITVPNSVTSIGNGAFKGTNPTKITLPFIGYSKTASGKANSVFGFVFGCTLDKNPNMDGTTTQYSEYIEYDGTRYYHFYIPKTIKEVEITNDVRIPYHAFYNCSWIEIIKINQGIESIGNSGFSGCTSLTNFEIPDSVTNIGTYAFSNCTSLKEVVLSDNISVLSDCVFLNCNNLETCNFPASLTQIGASAFVNCSSLSKADLRIPEGVTSIGDNAFENCSLITSITVPNSVTKIGGAAFKGTNPTKITLPFIGYSKTASGKSNSVFGFVFGCTLDKNPNMDGTTTQYSEYIEYDGTRYYHFYIPKTIKEVEITNDVRIPYHAFYNCSWIEIIKINQGIESIGNSGFSGCTSLTNFEIPDSVTNIGTYAFSNCTSLKEVVLSDNISVLSDCVFLNCNNLETCNFPASLTQIGASAFVNCSSLSKADLRIPEGVTSIGDNAFENCSLITSITVPNSVTKIGGAAFKGTNPTKITLPFIGYSKTASGKANSVFGFVFGCTLDKNSNMDGTTTQYSEYIEYDGTRYYHFYIPKTIKEVEITNDVRIPYHAFYNCSWIEKVTINDIEGDASKVGTDAFYNCKEMTVYINRNTAVHTYCERNGIRHCSTKSILLDSDSLVLFRNEAKTIGSEVVLLNGKVDTEPETVWTSSNPEVASVDRYTGVITAVAPGTATITAGSEGVTTTAEVTVYFKLDGITLNKASTEIDIHKTEKLTVIYNPDNTTDSKDITWRSSDETVATVDKDGVVSALKKGKATITATGFNGVQATCTVQVLLPITEITFENSAVTIPRGTRQKVPFIVSPSDTTDTYTVTSSDIDIATVDRFGTVVAKKIGTAVITVTSSRGLAESCVVTVNSPASSVTLSQESKSLFVGKTFALTAEMQPKDTTDSITWTSSNEDVVVVTPDGFVTAMSKGTATITATADSGASASCEVEVESDIAATTVLLAYQETEYDGSENLPAVDVYYNGDKLVENTDYSLSYLNNTDVGTASVFVTSLHDGTEVEKQFVIKPLTVRALDISCKAVMTYTGKALKALEEVTYQSLRLTEGVDYTVTYENNTNAGAATVTITGRGNFCDAITKTFTIAPKSIESATVTLGVTSYTYDGSAKTPVVTVKDGITVLTEGTDYSISYAKNTHAGDAVVTAKGLNNYGSSTAVTFKIYPKSLSGAVVTLDNNIFACDGTEKCPTVTVTENDATLTEITDYKVEYKTNKEPGTATVTIVGQGDYTGTLTTEFSIIQLGDINQNGTVEIQDVTALQRHLAEFTNRDGSPIVDEENEEVFKIADVNHDGSISIADITMIQRYLAEFIDSFA